MDLCAFWKARVRKELLSERDGNYLYLTIIPPPSEMSQEGTTL